MSTIEELEEKIKAVSGRAPASQSGSWAPKEQVEYKKPMNIIGTPVSGEKNPNLSYSKTLNLVPELDPNTDFSDPSIPRIVPGGNVTGAKAPDYSGFSSLEDELKKIKPKNNSNLDLLAMGLSTGLGAMFGQVGAGAKVAGAYGLERAKAAEKAENDLEKQLLAIKLAKAKQMGKGSKGTSTGGLTANQVLSKVYIDNKGLTRRHQFIGPDGTLLKDPSDPQVTFDPKTMEYPLPDGTKITGMRYGNQFQKIGMLNPAATIVEDARGNKTPVNKHTVLEQGMPEGFNKTQMGLSKKANEEYSKITTLAAKDNNLARYQQAASDLRAASAALGSGGPLSPAFLLASQRFLGMGMDKGRSLTNDEFSKVEGVNAGVVDKMRNLLLQYKEGKVGSDLVRQEYARLTALLSNNVTQLRNERLGEYNRLLKIGLGDEYRPELSIPLAEGLSGKKQQSDVSKTDKLTDELAFEKTKVVTHPTHRHPDGRRRKIRMKYSPEQKKYIYDSEAN